MASLKIDVLVYIYIFNKIQFNKKNTINMWRCYMIKGRRNKGTNTDLLIPNT